MDVSDAPDMPRRPRGFFFFEVDTDISNPNGSGFGIGLTFSTLAIQHRRMTGSVKGLRRNERKNVGCK